MDHALTIRLPSPVYEGARRLADRLGISLNRLVQEALAEKAERALAERLDRAYDLLSAEESEADVEPFLALQAEALLNG